MIKFTNARLLKHSENGFTVQNGVLETDGGVITVSGELPSKNIPERTIDLKGKGLIIPGFKNAHTHSAMTFLRSYADDMPLDKWLTEQVFPMEARLDGEYIRKFARLAFLEYLRNGITACFDMYVEPDAMAQAAEETGMRLVMCGTVNDFKDSPELLEDFYVIHLCGKGNLDNKLTGTIGYAQFEYVSAELTDMFALADMAISRAGANSICELLALHKPNILIPLSAAASRGDQVLNANSFKKQGFSFVLEEEELTADSLLNAVKEVYENRDKYISAMSQSGQMDSIGTIVELINKEAKL